MMMRAHRCLQDYLAEREGTCDCTVLLNHLYFIFGNIFSQVTDLLV